MRLGTGKHTDGRDQYTFRLGYASRLNVIAGLLNSVRPTHKQLITAGRMRIGHCRIENAQQYGTITFHLSSFPATFMTCLPCLTATAA